MATGKKNERRSKADDPEEAGEQSAEDPARVVDADGEPSEGIVLKGDTAQLAQVDEEAEEDDSDTSAAQLGIDKYVLAAFFAAGMLVAYITGRLIHGVWASAANTSWFSRTLPVLAGVGDEQKTTYGMVVGGIVALVLVLRLYRNPDIRTWADEVATELTKVKWPTKKDVTNATLIVITATTVATVYLTLLDRFWSFVTSIVYGDGS
ncbi:preprotein translocase subunit SecE [Chondromyces apiculatus]|uniref:preprotein translocase subunit SecE n=1 Tax=Chondromyces apiculatus TaxID=51 RepID=UPI0009DDD8DC|nr:preprotein translocase subunit SecE [Chondromyces apiculatus]